MSDFLDSQQHRSTSEGSPTPTEPIPELQKLGTTLAAARRQRGLDVELLAERLRIGTSQLKALEAGDHAHLPEGVFVIALARRVASALEINIDDDVQDLRGSALMRRPQPRPPLTPAPQRPSKGVPGGPTLPKKETSRSRSRDSQGAAPWILGVPLVLAGLGLATALSLKAWNERSTASLPSPPTPVGVKASAPEPRVVRSAKPAKTGAPAPGAPPLPAQPTAAASMLRLKASEPSWIQVRQSDGKVIFEGTLSGEQSFPLGRGLEVLAGRPYAVLAALGEGQGRPLGGVDDISWHRFSPSSPASSTAAPPSASRSPTSAPPKATSPEPATAAP